LSAQGARIWLRGALRWEPPEEFLAWFHRETGGRPRLMRAGLEALAGKLLLVRAGERQWALGDGYQSLALAAQLGLDAAPPPHNLPATLTAFVGREREAAQVAGLLGRSRLVTLVGAAGIGKTRLALEVAGDMLPDCPHGAWLVPLAAMATPELIASAIASALGLKEVADQPLLERLKLHLQHKQLLLLLDNFEQVAAGAPLISELLAAAPGLLVLVTSRHVLRLADEQQFIVPALPLPPAGDPPSPGRLAHCASIALFVARAQAADAGFELDDDNAGEVARLCRQLEGVPLALELAAARIRELQPSAMLAAMRHRLEWLTGGPRDLPLRQQTLRNAIDWSYSLLDPFEQTVFAGLAVFAGGFTAEAARATLSAPDGDEPERALHSLADKSLLVRNNDGRFAMLGTIRDYAEERLGDDAGAAALRSRHAWHYAGMARAAEPELKGARQQQCIAGLKPELDNMRQALRWGREHDHLLLATISAAIWRLWCFGGHLTEGAAWLAVAIERGGAAEPAIQANLRHGLGLIAWMRGEYAEAGELFGAARAIREALGDEAGSALMCNNLGHLAMLDGRLDEANRLLETALEIQRRLGDTWGSAYAIINLGSIALRQERYDDAAAHYRESLELRRALNDQRGTAGALGNLGWLALCQGREREARASFAESMALFHSQDNLIGIAESMAGMAEAAAMRQDWRRAARLSGASHAVYETIGARLWPDIGTPYERHLSAMAERRATPAFAACWEEGCAMAMDQAIAYALEGARADL
ncbi:MAG TPA: tetratricopeptide repeat protein, partial [Herpetosiphonaceae bacterium]